MICQTLFRMKTWYRYTFGPVGKASSSTPFAANVLYAIWFAICRFRSVSWRTWSIFLSSKNNSRKMAHITAVRYNWSSVLTGKRVINSPSVLKIKKTFFTCQRKRVTVTWKVSKMEIFHNIVQGLILFRKLGKKTVKKYDMHIKIHALRKWGESLLMFSQLPLHYILRFKHCWSKTYAGPALVVNGPNKSLCYL